MCLIVKEEAQVTVTGVAFENGSSSQGSGVLVDDALLALRAARICRNRSHGSGGAGLYARNGASVTIEDSEVCANSALHRGVGGGLVVQQATLHVRNTEIYDNRAVKGGGIYAGKGSRVTLADVVVEGNSAEGQGGGLYVEGGGDTRATVSMKESKIAENTAGIRGGGIAAEARAEVSLEDVVVTENSTTGGGGGLCAGAWFELGDSPTVSIRRSEFAENSAWFGGGIAMYAGAEVTLEGVDVHANTAHLGGGLYGRAEGVARITNSRFRDNRADMYGGGLCTGGGLSAEAGWDLCFPTAVVSDSEFAENSAGNSGGGVAAQRGARISLEGVEVNANEAAEYGGGLYATGTGTSIDAEDSKVNQNSITSGHRESAGGGLTLMDGASVTLSAVQVEGNTAPRGGGIGVIRATLRIRESSAIQGNEATGTAKSWDQSAGGIYIQGYRREALVELENSDVNGNVARLHGGGLCLWGSRAKVVISSGTIKDNSCGKAGGAMLIANGAVTLSGVEVSGNRVSESGGGAIRMWSGARLTAQEHTVFANNRAHKKTVGAIDAMGPTTRVMLADSEVRDDSGREYLAAISVHNGAELILSRVLVTGYRTVSEGGAVKVEPYEKGEPLSEIDISSCRITGNTAGAGLRLAATGIVKKTEISKNGGPGVVVVGESSLINLDSNSIWANGGLGIDLDDDGITPNSVQRSDVPPDLHQTFPVLEAATVNTGDVTIIGKLTSRPHSDYTIQFFRSREADSSGYGEGQQCIGSSEVTTDAKGHVEFSQMVSRLPHTIFFTATATDREGRTSEFSNAVRVEKRTRSVHSDGEEG